MGQVHCLRDGTEVVVTPISPEEVDELVRFHDSLSRDTIRLRFFRVHPHLSTTEAAHFTQVDHRDREALTVRVDDEIIGIGRYERVGDSDAAEVAFVVADRWQAAGVGTLLLQQLIEHARAIGLGRLTADTLAENQSMLEVFRHCGLATTRSISCGVVTLTMAL
jgi:RimJ/RimL family protein N-acetyltransferase